MMMQAIGWFLLGYCVCFWLCAVLRPRRSQVSLPNQTTTPPNEPSIQPSGYFVESTPTTKPPLEGGLPQPDTVWWQDGKPPEPCSIQLEVVKETARQSPQCPFGINDLVEYKQFNGKKVQGTVERIGSYLPAQYVPSWWWVSVRRVGKTKAGRRYGLMEIRSTYLTKVGKLDPLPANVYADFLEEEGFSEAADRLRAKFPLDSGKEE